MSAATTILMVRHAPHSDVGLRLTGRAPGAHLGERGRAMAARLADRIAAGPVEAIYASPRERTRETAEAIGARCGRAVEIDPALDEIEFGAWTGRAFADLAGDPDWERWNAARADGVPPGGEPMRAVGERVGAALERWRSSHPGGRVIAVSHADVIKAALCGVLGLSADRHASFDIDPASVSTVIAWEGGAKVAALNERPAGA